MPAPIVGLPLPTPKAGLPLIDVLIEEVVSFAAIVASSLSFFL